VVPAPCIHVLKLLKVKKNSFLQLVAHAVPMIVMILKVIWHFLIYGQRE